MTIEAARFLTEVDAITAEEPGYKLGHWGKDGYCDCIGLVIGAIRRAGGEWRGLHGSNYAARKEMDWLRKIGSAGELQAGEVVYKAREPNEGGYSLPERYTGRGEYATGDLRDYYHVGVVISTNPLRIRHMTTPRPKTDKEIGKWGWHGKLKKVSLGQAGSVSESKAAPSSAEKNKGGQKVESYEAIVSTGNESPLNVRKEKSTSSALVAQIPNGACLTVIGEDGIWSAIQYRGTGGWVMSKFLSRSGETIQVEKQKLESIYDLIGDMLGLRG